MLATQESRYVHTQSAYKDYMMHVFILHAGVSTFAKVKYMHVSSSYHNPGKHSAVIQGISVEKEFA